MTRSFLNIVTVDGKLYRVAEFGFFADMPSFSEEYIIFRQGERYKKIDLETGMISSAAPPTEKSLTSQNGAFTLRLDFTSELTNGRGYTDLVLRDNKNSTESVLTRFMGCEGSIGDMPFSADSRRIAFFGYPEDELG